MDYLWILPLLFATGFVSGGVVRYPEGQFLGTKGRFYGITLEGHRKRCHT